MVVQIDISGRIPDELGHVHFVGIGGSGMSGIARLMAQRGLEVTGSDRESSYSTDALQAEGIRVYIGHDAAHVEDDVDTLVVTSALWPDNPELMRARERGIPVLHRSQALAWLTRGKRLIAVAGAHGKTTSTGMIVVALQQLGLDPSWVNGGVVAQLGASSGAGSSDLFVIEADESDGSFLVYNPAITLITNIDTDHLAHYGTMDNFEAAFVRFASGASEATVISSDNALCQAILSRIRAPKVVTFGASPTADVRVGAVQSADGVTRSSVTAGGEQVDFELRVPGAHNATNAVGVVAVLMQVGIEPARAVHAVEAFVGTKRRMDLHGEVRGVRVFDDYAHHPVEVHAALQAARTLVHGSGRVIAVQQPHLYSRTQQMAAQFAQVLEQDADYTVVLDVYGAREDPIPGVTGQLLIDHFADRSRVSYRPDWQDAADEVARVARAGDVVVTLGCGNVYRIIPQVLAALEDTER